MALAATTVFEVRTTGSDSACGGGFDPALGGTDYTLQDAAQATGTASSSGTTLTATTGIFTPAMVGNMATNGSTWKQITAYTSSTVVTLDSAPTWTAQAISVGGAFATPGRAASVAVASNTIFIKAGTYSMSGSVNTAGGPVQNAPAGASGAHAKICGYSTNRNLNNTDTRPVFQPTAGSLNLFDQNSYTELINLDIIVNGQSSIQGVRIGGDRTVICKRVRVTGTQYAFNEVGSATMIDCEAISCTHGFFHNSPGTGKVYVNCSSRNNATTEAAFTLNQYAVAKNCLSLGNPGPGFLVTSDHVTIDQCVADGSTGTTGNGFVTGQNFAVRLTNCIALNNALYGFNSRNDNSATANPQDGLTLMNCAGYLNTSGNLFSCFVANQNSFGFVALAANPFNNAGALDYTLHATNGSSLVATGFPSSFAGITGTNSANVGLFTGAAASASSNIYAMEG